ncbi:MAG: Acyl dehydratase [Chloroflexi bacterium]|jgi:acyl dehydratase|nr:MAG: Acyl dehydratase [Chloroflexota bacterium]
MTTSAISPQSLDECRDLLGVWLRRRGHNTVVAEGAIHRWTKAIGDRNPLFLDPNHAPNSSVGAPVAPPCWLYTVDDTIVALKFPELHVVYGGTDWEFFRWARVGKEITTRARLIDIQVKDGRFSGAMIQQTGEVEYLGSTGEVVARATSTVLRTSREEAVKLGKYNNLEAYRYSQEELFGVEDAYDAEEYRGPDPRYWEDVEVGDHIQPVVKGPLTSEDVLQFICATRPAPGFSRFVRERQRHPSIAFQDANTGTWNSWEAGMLDNPVARMMGFPGAHDCGLDRISWVSQLLTNWMGDAGFLSKLSVRLTRPNLYGDVTWCEGSVSSKGSQGVVELNLQCRDQRGETTAAGTAEVILPSRVQPTQGSGAAG